MSNETKIDDIIMRNYIKYLLPLFIIYFVYQNYNLSIIVVILLAIVFFNMNVGNKLNNNIYFNKIKEGFNKYTNIENFSNIKHFSNIENFSNIKNFSNTYNLDNLSFDLKKEDEEDQKHEPFKNEVMNIRELYNNIRSEINNLTK